MENKVGPALDKGKRKERGTEDVERGKVWRIRGCLKTCFFLSLFTQRIHLDIRIGEHDLDAAIAQAKDKVNEVSFKLEHLIEQIEQIVKEQNYQRVSMPSQLIFTSSCQESTSPKPLNQGKNNLLFLDLPL